MITLLILFLFAHALADYPLQGDFLSKAKNPTAPIPGVPWYQAMVAHSAIQAGFVYLISSCIYMALFELVVHFIIDYLKCTNRISFNTDQVLHVVCKIAYVITLTYLWGI